MRELKFRMLTQTTGKILGYVDIYDLLRSGPDVLPDFEEAVWEGVKFEPYTGLKDKNGKEIYEGDIVKVDKLFDAIVVGYDAGGFVLHNEDWDCVVSMGRDRENGLGIELGDRCTTGEVIGNIHENKELLENE